MDKIDLTLRREFTANANRRDQYDDTVQYNNKLDFKDQRRAKLDILQHDTFFMFFPIIRKEHLEFFGEHDTSGWDEVKLHETILSITGILTKSLRSEYDSGYGNENVCVCCGGFRSHLLNSQRYGLCDRCEKFSKYRNEKFWERREDFAFEETWID